MDGQTGPALNRAVSAGKIEPSRQIKQPPAAALHRSAASHACFAPRMPQQCPIASTRLNGQALYEWATLGSLCLRLARDKEGAQEGGQGIRFHAVQDFIKAFIRDGNGAWWCVQR